MCEQLKKQFSPTSALGIGRSDVTPPPVESSFLSVYMPLTSTAHCQAFAYDLGPATALRRALIPMSRAEQAMEPHAQCQIAIQARQTSPLLQPLRHS